MGSNPTPSAIRLSSLTVVPLGALATLLVPKLGHSGVTAAWSGDLGESTAKS